ncbi:uncharacterized protein Z520_07941 [Fonsecaea multimorphosa CBS 102226]|uniref:Uncharacterized protein n=1 Tax=Fonsecaea multimorphosa CBS 102226 TaxID=1442371 RepID=A0A0D2KHK4_9EURO|nr:uncharacterized protein Z520_07941 [Fonsecaea multimorphosa CBS 102226]KIX96163.1 hypothetical protein Z520_07941 [Fonsecaea multimorphosa CBS 102226]OAL22256.1 hypothetical protein AYO22_07300 [Fonsecaea multimorphosa]
MSVTVKHLNLDAAFLLVFSPKANPLPSDLTPAAGAVSVLIDPWTNGPSINTASWSAGTEDKIPSSIGEPDVLIVSQNKPDLRHKGTLLQLRPEGKTIIAAEPGAAKAIKSWNHFDPTRVHALLKYDPKVKSGRSLRLPIAPLSPQGFPGELNIAFIPAKRHRTGLHNAIGITYLPPTHTKSIAPIATVDLPKTTRYFHMPLSPMTMPPSSPPAPSTPLADRSMSFDLPAHDSGSVQSPKVEHFRGHRPRLSRSSNTASSEFLPAADQPTIRMQSEPDTEKGGIVQRVLTIPDQSVFLDSAFRFELDPVPFTFVKNLPTPPASPVPAAVSSPAGSSPNPSAKSPTRSSTLYHHRHRSSVTSHQKSLSSVSSMPNLAPITPARPKAVSIIYSPHGVPLSDLQPYIQTHLVRLAGALPLTLLFHSFDSTRNPWYLGGSGMAGMYGGAEIARALMARCWINAHDDPRDNRGTSVKRQQVKRISVDEVRRHLWEGEEGEWLKKRGWTCDVRQLHPGREVFIGPSRDLCSGMEGKRESRLLRFGGAGEETR